MIKILSIDDLCPNISSFTMNPMKKLKNIYIVNPTKYIFQSVTLLNVKEDEIIRNTWLMEKYTFSLFTYKQAFDTFEQLCTSNYDDKFNYYFILEGLIEQLLSAEYQFAVYYARIYKEELYPKNDKDGLWARLNKCYNGTKHFDDANSGQVNSFYKNFLSMAGFSNSSASISYNEMYEILNQNADNLQKLIDNV
jgi:hypothetical protein